MKPDELLAIDIMNYFVKNFDEFLAIKKYIFDEKKVSMRKIEYFVNNELEAINKEKYDDFRLMTKKYSKKYFDFYSRGKEIIKLEFCDVSIDGSIAFLHFVKWMMMNDIIVIFFDFCSKA